jgi:hypothetical protein
MRPKTHLVFVFILSLLIGVGIIITIFITHTPRSIEYHLEEIKSYGNAAPEGSFDSTFGEMLLDLDLEYEIESSDFSSFISPAGRYGQRTLDIPMKEAVQGKKSRIIGNADYIRFSEEEGVRTCVFRDPDMEGKGTEIKIVAYNLNLKRRQIGVFLFFEEEGGEVVGYVLNNLWMKPRSATRIILKTPCRLSEGGLMVLRDFDENEAHFTQRPLPADEEKEDGPWPFVEEAQGYSQGGSGM